MCPECCHLSAPRDPGTETLVAGTVGGDRSVTSVIIAAHNEARVIDRCLDAVLRSAPPVPLDIVVAANGCTDDTADVAGRRPGVRVLHLTTPGKAAALNAAEQVASGFPRIYLDADIVLAGRGIRGLIEALDTSGAGPLAVSPRRVLEVSGRPLVVRGWCAVNQRLPVFTDALFGRGAIALSEHGRARFDAFPEIVADDLFLDSLFAPGEKKQVGDVISYVGAPYRTSALINRLVRVRRANTRLRAAAAIGTAPAGVRSGDGLSWLRDVVLPRPWLVPAGVCYAGVTVAAAAKARRDPGTVWERDESTR
jgi:glycosyltransferase involved in cell wall biosynthesis